MKPITLLAVALALAAPSMLRAQANTAPSPSVPASPDAPGMTWRSLKTLPAFMGSLWVPDNAPANEIAYLKSLTYPRIKAEYLPDAKARIRDLIVGKDTLPSEGCTFDGMPRAAWYPYPVQFLFAPGNVMIQQHDVVRAAIIGTLDHPAEIRDKDRLQQFEFYGHEVAQWQGDTLVIDTIAAREETETFYGLPNDFDLHVVERYRLISPDRLERRTTVEAPEYFVRPWVVVTTFHRAAEASWATHFCLPKTAKVKAQ